MGFMNVTLVQFSCNQCFFLLYWTIKILFWTSKGNPNVYFRKISNSKDRNKNKFVKSNDKDIIRQQLKTEAG